MFINVLAPSSTSENLSGVVSVIDGITNQPIDLTGLKIVISWMGSSIRDDYGWRERSRFTISTDDYVHIDDVGLFSWDVPYNRHDMSAGVYDVGCTIEDTVNEDRRQLFIGTQALINGVVR